MVKHEDKLDKTIIDMKEMISGDLNRLNISELSLVYKFVRTAFNLAIPVRDWTREVNRSRSQPKTGGQTR